MRISSYAADFGNWFKLPLSANLNEGYYQFAYLTAGTITSVTRPICKWCKGDTVLGGIKLNHTYQRLELWTGNFAMKVAEGSHALSPDTWYAIEVYFKIDDSAGVLILRLDMLEEAVFYGDTKPGADTQIDNFVHGNTGATLSYFDDLIVHDTTGAVNNSWPNGGKVALLLPSADGSTLQWTPTPGPGHYSAIDDIPPSSTDYIQADDVDKVDELALADLPVEALSVKAVIPQVWAAKSGIISPTQLQLGLKLGATDYYSSDLLLPSSYGLVKNILNGQPSGGSFAVADINGAQLLLKSRA